MTSKKRVGILISGRGSNMAALIDACAQPDYPARIAVVVSNQPSAGGLKTAQDAGIDVAVIDHRAFESREDFDSSVNDLLHSHGCEIVCNAGFMRLQSEFFVQKWLNRHLNIHPSLLPSYRGLNTHERVVDDGVRVSGCTVHFVRNEMDSGPIIAQAAVPVQPDDTADTLSARVLSAEHVLYPLALRLVAQGSVRVIGEKVVTNCDACATDVLFSPEIS